MTAVRLINTLRGEQESDIGSNIDIVKKWQSVPMADVEGKVACLSDEWESFDRNGNVVMTRESMPGMVQLFLGSFSDWRYVLNHLREEDGAVIMRCHFEGKFTGDLDLSAMGMGLIPASGKDIVWEENDQKVTVVEGKIAREEPYGHDGGFGPFLAALGVTPPVG